MSHSSHKTPVYPSKQVSFPYYYYILNRSLLNIKFNYNYSKFIFTLHAFRLL